MSLNRNIFCITGPLWGKFTSHWWISLTKASGLELSCFFYLHLNKRLSKQSRHWWFEMQSCDAHYDITVMLEKDMFNSYMQSEILLSLFICSIIAWVLYDIYIWLAMIERLVCYKCKWIFDAAAMLSLSDLIMHLTHGNANLNYFCHM